MAGFTLSTPALGCHACYSITAINLIHNLGKIVERFNFKGNCCVCFSLPI